MNRISLILVLLFISITTFGKTYAGKTIYVQGYIITLEQDTLYGKIKIWIDKNNKLMPSKIEDRVVFAPEKGKRKTYFPGSIRYFYFFYNLETITYASVPFFKGQLFMKVISETGYLSMYWFYPDEDKGLSTAYNLAEFVYATDFREISFFYILKPDTTYLFLGRHTPRNKILDFFANNPEVAEKIKSREYNYTDVYRMVREYNKYMAEKLD